MGTLHLCLEGLVLVGTVSTWKSWVQIQGLAQLSMSHLTTAKMDLPWELLGPKFEVPHLPGSLARS